MSDTRYSFPCNALAPRRSAVFRSSRRALLHSLQWAAPFGLILMAGCLSDAVSYSQQRVILHITEPCSGTPVSGAWVEFKEVDNAWEESVQSGKAEKWLESRMNGGQGADPAGVADLVVNVTRPPLSDPRRDWVSGHTYVFGIAAGGKHEMLSVHMLPGQRCQGRLFTLTVASIGRGMKVSHEVAWSGAPDRRTSRPRKSRQRRPAR